MAHPNCERKADGIVHACQEPSGRVCIENGCDLPAGTHWGPYWCPDHDVERLDRITRNLEGLMAELEGQSNHE